MLYRGSGNSPRVKVIPGIKISGEPQEEQDKDEEYQPSKHGRWQESCSEHTCSERDRYHARVDVYRLRLSRSPYLGFHRGADRLSVTEKINPREDKHETHQFWTANYS